MDALDYCNPFEESCNWLNGGLLPGPGPTEPPSRFCRSKSQPWMFTFWPANRDCPEGYSPTTYGSSRICPEPGCQLGVISGFCTEFWIMVALAAFVVWKGKIL